MSGPALDWHLIVVASGVTSWNGALWDTLVGSIEGLPVALTVVETGGGTSLSDRLRGAQRTNPAISHVSMRAGQFSWGRAANAGFQANEAVHVCFLHDDATVPEGTGWLDELREALAYPGAGLAVPRVTGDGAAAQTDPAALVGDARFCHTTEFVSGCCLAVRSADFPGFMPESGYDWQQIDLQQKFARRGLSTVVALRLEIAHAGSATYGADARDEPFRANCDAYCGRNGINVEEGSRPEQPRIAPPLPYNSTALALIADDAAILRSRLKNGPVDRFAEVIVVDVGGTQRVHDVARARSPAPMRYSPALGDPISQSCGMTSAEIVRVEDLRTGEVSEGRRVRFGHYYGLMSRARELHIGAISGNGIGDALLFTPAFADLKRTYPRVRIVAYHGWAAGELWLNNPDIDEVRIGGTPPPEFMSLRSAVGEGIVRAVYGLVGLDWRDFPDRRFKLVLTERELARARDWLDREGVPPGWRLVALQEHGNFAAKQWGNSAAFRKLLRDRGASVLLMGSERERRTPAIGDREFSVDGLTLREAAALIAQCDAFVGFDSGLTYMAVAVGTPTVSLFGPHDPRYLVADAAATNLVAIRKMTPQMCFKRRGDSCRHSNFGHKCPFRERQPATAAPMWQYGGDCIDAISAEEVMAELDCLPKRGKSPRAGTFGGIGNA